MMARVLSKFHPCEKRGLGRAQQQSSMVDPLLSGAGILVTTRCQGRGGIAITQAAEDGLGFVTVTLVPITNSVPL